MNMKKRMIFLFTTLIALFFVTILVFSQIEGSGTVVSPTEDQTYFKKSRTTTGKGQAGRRGPWRQASWERRIQHFIQALRKGDRKAFLYVEYSLLAGYDSNLVMGYPSKNRKRSGVILSLQKEAVNKKTSIIKIITKNDPKIRKKVIHATLSGLFNKDPRVRLTAVNFLRRLIPDPIMIKDVKRALLMETVTTEKAKWRPKDIDIPSIENPRLGWGAVTYKNGELIPLNSKYYDGYGEGVRGILNGNAKGRYLSEGLYGKGERNDYPTDIIVNYLGDEAKWRVWTKASLLRYGADEKISGFEKMYGLSETEKMPKSIYLYMEPRAKTEALYTAYHSVWEEMKKLELFISRAVWFNRIKNGDLNAMKYISKDTFRVLADQIDGESLKFVPMALAKTSFRKGGADLILKNNRHIFTESEYRQVVVGLLHNRVTSTREECARWLKGLFESSLTSHVVKKEIKKALKEARRRVLIGDTIRGRHLHAEVVAPSGLDEISKWWGELDEVDTSKWPDDQKREMLELYRNQVEYPEESEIYFHNKRKPGQEQEVKKEDEITKKKDVKSETAEKKDVKSETAEKKDVKSETAEKKDVKSETTEKKDVKSETTEKKDVKSETAEKKDVKSKTTTIEQSDDTTTIMDDVHPLISSTGNRKANSSEIEKYLQKDSFILKMETGIDINERPDLKKAASEAVLKVDIGTPDSGSDLSTKKSDPSKTAEEVEEDFTSKDAGDEMRPGQSPGIIPEGKKTKTGEIYKQTRMIETLFSLLLGDGKDLLEASYIDVQDAVILWIQLILDEKIRFKWSAKSQASFPVALKKAESAKGSPLTSEEKLYLKGLVLYEAKKWARGKVLNDPKLSTVGGYEFMEWFILGSTVAYASGKRKSLPTEYKTKALRVELWREKNAASNLKKLWALTLAVRGKYSVNKISTPPSGVISKSKEGYYKELPSDAKKPLPPAGESNTKDLVDRKVITSGHGKGGYLRFHDIQVGLDQAQESDSIKIANRFYSYSDKWSRHRKRMIRGLLTGIGGSYYLKEHRQDIDPVFRGDKDPRKRLIFIHMLRRLIPDKSMYATILRLIREVETVDQRPYYYKDIVAKTQIKIVFHELLKLQRLIMRRKLVEKIRRAENKKLLAEIPKGAFLSLVVRVDAEWDPFRIPLRSPLPRLDKSGILAGGYKGMFFNASDIDMIAAGLNHKNFLVQREVARWIVTFYNQNRGTHIPSPDNSGSGVMYTTQFLKYIAEAEAKDIIYYERNYVKWRYTKGYTGEHNVSKATEYVDDKNKPIARDAKIGTPVGRIPVRIGSWADRDLFRKLDRDRIRFTENK